MPTRPRPPPMPIEMPPPPMIPPPPDEEPPEGSDDRSRLREEEADLLFFVLLSVATHLPSTSAVPLPHSSGHTRSLRAVTASSASGVGSWLGIDILAWRP